MTQTNIYLKQAIEWSEPMDNETTVANAVMAKATIAIALELQNTNKLLERIAGALEEYTKTRYGNKDE